MKVVIVVCMLLVSVRAAAQCDSLAQVMASTDTLYAVDSVGRVDSTIKVAPNELAPYYYFDFQQDSSRVFYRVGEFVLNSRWLYLDHWCLDKVYNFDEQADTAKWEFTNAELSALSRTKTFPAVAGDTVSFYREYYWLDHTNNSTVNAAKLVSDHELSMSVELRLASNDARITLLDSIHINTTTQNGKPCIVSWKPIMARVRYLVPATVTDTTLLYIQANVYASGSAPSTFLRADAHEYCLSPLHLDNSYWQSYANSVASENSCSASCDFSATAYSTPRRIVVTIEQGQTSFTDLAVYDLYGNLVTTASAPLSSPTTLSVQNPGLYIVVALENGSVVCSEIVLVP